MALACALSILFIQTVWTTMYNGQATPHSYIKLQKNKHFLYAHCKLIMVIHDQNLKF